MGSLISSLYTGASGIFTSQTAVQVTGNNIANVNTKGYSRQTANISSSTPLEQGGLVYGTGSTVDHIDRAGDSFITKQLIAQSATYGEYEASSTPLSDIEQSLSISDSSLSSDIDNFFDAWEQLGSNPAGTAERQQVIQEASNMADRFQQIDQQLTGVVNGINTTIESKITNLNEQMQQVASLNSNIFHTETSGGDANTLKDQRDLLVQQVSETCGATSYADNNDMVCLQLSNGTPLVTGSNVSIFSTSKINGATQVTLTNGGSSTSLSANDFNGELKGLLSVRDVYVPELRNDMDQLAYTIATDVNSLHTTGIDKNGATGTDLFTLTAPADPTAPAWQGAAGSIAVGFSDPALIAAGKTYTTGDNGLTKSIAALRDTASISGSTYTEEYARIATRAGSLVSSNEQKLSDSSSLLDGINTKRDSVSGVSTDEEMVLLIQYQAGYKAAANFLTTIKDMLDTLVKI